MNPIQQANPRSDPAVARQVSATLAEVFSGIQGEALFLGSRQIFVRFSGCNLNCRWCDTPETRDPSESFRAEVAPGRREFETVSNPASMEGLLGLIDRLSTLPHHSVSLTGGEPLLQSAFIAPLLSELKVRGLRVMLETNGSLPDEARSLCDLLDWVAMDIKLASSGAAGVPLQQHRRFLSVLEPSQVFVKIVVSAETDEAELAEAIRLVGELGSKVPVFLQPVSPINGGRLPDPNRLLQLHAMALRLHKNVRVVPQVHKVLGQI